MIVSLNYQAQLFVLTVLIGVGIGFLYDVLRILRCVYKHPNFIIQLEDFLYWLTAVISMFLIMLDKNNGEIRFFTVCGAFLGMIFYFLTVSPFVMKVSDFAVNIIKQFIMLLLTIILTPFRLVFLLFKSGKIS